MKFIAYAALALGATAVRLTSHSATLQGDGPPQQMLNDLHELAMEETKGKGTITLDELKTALKHLSKKHDWKLPKGWQKEAKKMFKAADTNGNGNVNRKELKAAIEGVEAEHEGEYPVPSREQVEEWVKKELAKDGSITKQEIIDAVVAWADAHDFEVPKDVWKMIDEEFNAVDTDGNGKLTEKEILAAVKKYDLVQMPDFPEPTEEQKKEIVEWVESELENGGTITAKEARDAIKAFAKKHNWKVTKEQRAFMKAAFEEVDTNDDGAIDADELKAAIEKHAE